MRPTHEVPLFFASEHYDFVPDILLAAKPLKNLSALEGSI
jgi:4-aminobutyrate aminotransferase-like enzyme